MTSNIESYPCYDEKTFSKDVIARWGKINDCLIDDESLMHAQMAHLGRTVTESFEKGDGRVAEEIFQFLESILARKDVISEIENAIAISFLIYSELEALGITDQVPSTILQIAKEQKESWNNTK